MRFSALPESRGHLGVTEEPPTPLIRAYRSFRVGTSLILRRKTKVKARC